MKPVFTTRFLDIFYPPLTFTSYPSQEPSPSLMKNRRTQQIIFKYLKRTLPKIESRQTKPNSKLSVTNKQGDVPDSTFISIALMVSLVTYT